MKKALITGITGQDGSYLTEFLLKKGYEIHAIVRPASVFTTERIDHLYYNKEINDKRMFLYWGDLTDSSNLNRILEKVQPDEIYNLAAQSHVKVSFDIPEYTAEVDAIGTLRFLDAIKELGLRPKFYQASTSELYGKVQEIPQTEKTPFYPRSPYAAAKLYAYWVVVNYREAYDLFACNGILFNHETIASFMPMFCKNANEGEFDIKPINEIVKFDQTKEHYQSKKVSGIQVWGKNGWVDVTFASAYPHDVKGDNKYPRFINSRSGAFIATANHVVFMKDNSEKKVKDIEVGDCLETIKLPEPLNKFNSLISKEEAELMGMMVGDGSITYSKKGIGVHGKFTNSSDKIRNRFSYLWSKVTGGHTVYYPSKSGFNPKKTVGRLRLVGGNNWLRKIDIYNEDRTKRIPKVILNSSTEIMFAFLKGYNMTDGLKKNPCTYEFKNFKTNSATLAMGLWYLIDKTTKQDINLTLEMKNDGRIFYSLNILSPVDNLLKEQKVRQLISKNLSQREISRETKISRVFIRKIQHGGSCCIVHHLKKNPLEVKKIIDFPEYNGWFYDLETTSGKFHCGIGKCHVHNSPRRGKTFVTRKITRAAASIKLGFQEKLYLGNLNAKRDWGYAPEYIEAMWLMLQQEKPDDFVIATGETHTIREFCEFAFRELDIYIDWQGKGINEKGIDRKTGKILIEVNPKYFRPTEVDILIGNPEKAKRILGWCPKTTFEELVKIMVKADFEEISKNRK